VFVRFVLLGFAYRCLEKVTHILPNGGLTVLYHDKKVKQKKHQKKQQINKKNSCKNETPVLWTTM